MEKRSATHVALGKSIRRLRLQLGVSQERFAQRCGIDRTYIGGIERGERDVSFSKLVQIAHGLGTTLLRVMLGFERELELELALAAQLAEPNGVAPAGASGEEQ